MLETSLLSIRIKVLIFYVIYLFVFVLWHYTQQEDFFGQMTSSRYNQRTLTCVQYCKYNNRILQIKALLIAQVGRYYILTWLACESLRDLFPAGATDVLQSVRYSYPPQLPDFPHMALVNPG